MCVLSLSLSLSLSLCALDRWVKELEGRLTELEGEWWVLQAHPVHPTTERLLDEVNGEWWTLHHLLLAATEGIIGWAHGTK